MGKKYDLVGRTNLSPPPTTPDFDQSCNDIMVLLKYFSVLCPKYYATVTLNDHEQLSLFNLHLSSSLTKTLSYLYLRYSLPAAHVWPVHPDAHEHVFGLIHIPPL